MVVPRGWGMWKNGEKRKMESRVVVDRDWREGVLGSECLMGIKFQFFKMKSSEGGFW